MSKSEMNTPLKKNNAPVYLDLPHFKWPWTAIISILHRISGVFLFLLFAPLLYILNLSTESEAGFEATQALFSSFGAAILLFIGLWGLLQHLLAGIRFLLIDFDFGVTKEKAHSSAKWVTAVAAVLAMAWTGALIL